MKGRNPGRAIAKVPPELSGAAAVTLAGWQAEPSKAPLLRAPIIANVGSSAPCRARYQDVSCLPTSLLEARRHELSSLGADQPERLPHELDGLRLLASCSYRSVMPSEWADLPASDAAARVKIGIETDRGPNAGTSPITRASGTKKTVLARHVRNDRLGDAVHQWVLGALRGSPGARAYYDAMRARNIGHHAALRQLGNRLVGILHGCLKTRAAYNESKAWAHHSPSSF
jgi:hypothetical protein